MNRIISGLLEEFRLSQKIDVNLSESEAFEYFAAHLAISSLLDSTSTTSHTIVGMDAQPAVDAIGILINGTLIENEDEIDSLIDINKYLDVDFVFVQAKTSESFDVSVLGQLCEFADDFIQNDSSTTDTDTVSRLRLIKNIVYKNSNYFKNRNPNIQIFYVTSGVKPDDKDTHFLQKKQKADAIFQQNGNIESCQIKLIGSKEIQQLKRQIDNSIETTIEFSRKIPLPPTSGIDDAYIGVVSAPTFIRLLTSPSGGMLSSIFYDNVRDWQGEENPVNSGIATALAKNESRARFVFMNNGVTVIAKKVQVTGDKVLLNDYQIVNGCQTSHVLWKNQNVLDQNVLIPLRIIATTDEKVVVDIIRATNSQTDISPIQLLATTDFQKELEQHFKMHNTLPLLYERRLRQYAASSVERSKVVSQINLMKAYASIVLQVPHKTTRDFQSVLKEAGTGIFGSKHKHELYYLAALTQYWVDHFLRKGMIDRELLTARFQIMLAFTLLNEATTMPPVESNAAKRWATELIEKLKDQDTAWANLSPAIELVKKLIQTHTDKKDAARSVSFTESVKAKAKGNYKKNLSSDRTDRVKTTV